MSLFLELFSHPVFFMINGGLLKTFVLSGSQEQLTLKATFNWPFPMSSDISALADSLFGRLGISCHKLVAGRREGTSEAGIYVSYSRQGDETLSIALRDGPYFPEHLVLLLLRHYTSIAGYVSGGSSHPFVPQEIYGVSASQDVMESLGSFIKGCSDANKQEWMTVHSQNVPLRYFPAFADYFVRRFSELSPTVTVAGSR